MTDTPFDAENSHAESRFYSENLDTHVALISYLATMKNLSRSPTMIARTLGMDTDKVLFALDHGKALFRKSRAVSSGSGEHFYTLHTRYGLRSQGEQDDGEDIARAPLTPEQISPMLDFVVRMAEQEHAGQRMMKIVEETRDSAKKSRIWSMCTAFIAALAVIVAGLLELIT